jgi:hypothetical protein
LSEFQNSRQDQRLSAFARLGLLLVCPRVDGQVGAPLKRCGIAFGSARAAKVIGDQ